MRHARHQAQNGQNARSNEQSRDIGQLRSGLLGHRLGCGHPGHDDGGGQRQEQGWNLGNQAVTNGQEHINARRVAHGQIVLPDANRQTTHDVDDQNQQACHGVTADEFGSTVHGAEEIRLLGQLFPAFFGGFLIDHTRVQIGIDRHLLARHGVQCEARIDLGHTTRTLGHHKEVHDHQNHKDDETNNVISTDHELAKRSNHLARRLGAFVAIDQDDPGRGHVQGQTQHGGEQQNRRKRRKFQRLARTDGDHDDHQADHDVEGEQDVQQQRGQRNHQHRHDQQDQGGQTQTRQIEARKVLSDRGQGQSVHGEVGAGRVNRGLGCKSFNTDEARCMPNDLTPPRWANPSTP